MPDSKRISIIIVNYRSEQHLPVCLASVYSRLEKQSESEVLVVNNDERGKITFIASQFPQVKIIEAGKNIGYGPASNLGARAATGRILFFLNPDAEIISPDILTLCRELERNPETAILGTRLVGAKGENQWWNAGVDITPCDTLLNNLKIIRSKKIWQSREKMAVGWVSGASLLIKKDIFEILGGFDENLFLYFEDIDLCRRVKKIGKKIMYFPEFSVKHLGGRSFADKKEQKNEFYQSQDYYFQKHFGKFQAVVLKVLRRALNWK